MTRLAVPALLALVLLAACGGTEDAAAPDTFSVRPAGDRGPLVGYDSAGAVRFRLPSGLASADGSSFVTARVRGATTDLVRYDASGGGVVTRRTVKGAWSLGAVSADGRIAALAASGAAIQGRTRLAVVEQGRASRVITLAGAFTIDAVAADGRSLFLIERLGSERYAVRLYDLAKGRLFDGSIRPKNEDEEMIGVAGGQVGTPDGRWLLTLYVNTQEHEAFVHALNLVDRFALCLDLPSRDAGIPALRGYGLAVSPRADAVFAANPRLGVLANVDLRELGSVRSAQLPLGGAAQATAVSPNGRMLYVASGRRLVGYDVAFGRVAGRAQLPLEPAGLTVTPDGRRVYAVAPSGAVRALDAATMLEAAA